LGLAGAGGVFGVAARSGGAWAAARGTREILAARKNAAAMIARGKRVRLHKKLFETIAEPSPKSAQESTTGALRFDDGGVDWPERGQE
jgi:hypothetical protein